MEGCEKMAIEYGPNFGKCGQHARWQFDGLNCITISGNGCVDRFENDVDYDRRIMRDPHDLGPWYEKPSFSESLIPKRVSRIVIQEGITQLTEMAFWSFLPSASGYRIPGLHRWGASSGFPANSPDPERR